MQIIFYRIYNIILFSIQNIALFDITHVHLEARDSVKCTKKLCVNQALCSNQ